jgi:hypothetical protein
MTERIVYDCDCCGRKQVVPIRVVIPTGRDSMNEIASSHLDVCDLCAGKLVKHLLAPLSFEAGEALLQKIKGGLR